MSARWMLLPALLIINGPSHAAIVGEVIAAFEGYSGRFAVMSAKDGGGFTLLNCGGDLSYNGSPRYFVQSVAGSAVLPDTYPNSELVASDEDCSRTVVLFSAPNMRFSTLPKWSHDGARIAVYGQVWDLAAGVMTDESGIYLADVVRDVTGGPVGISNLHLVIASPAEPNFAWSGDDQRIAYVAGAPDGKGGIQQDIWVFDIAAATATNTTNTPGSNEDQPTYSPVADRIAFTRFVGVKGTYRYDIFTMQGSGGVATQVTSKSNSSQPQNKFPCYSPDGQYLAFGAGSTMTAPFHDMDIYRIKADGSGKATNLTSRRSGTFRIPAWRR